MTYVYLGASENHVTITTDTDCVGPDIKHFAGIVTHQPDALMTALANIMQAAGLEVSVEA